MSLFFGTQPALLPENPQARGVLTTALHFAALALLSCGGNRHLESVAPPTNLDQLGTSVKDQYLSRRQTLNDLDQGKKTKPEVLGEAWGELGQWYQAYQYPSSAMACYRNAHQRDTADARWPYLLGRLSLEAGDLATAKACFEKALSLDPTADSAQVALGDLACDRQDGDTGALHYGDVLKRNPENSGALFGMAKLFLSRGDGKTALGYLDTLERLQPQATQVLYLSATAWTQLGDGERANEYFARVPEDNNMHRPLNPDDPWMQEIYSLNRGEKQLTRQGMIALRQGDYEKAAVLAGRAVGESPDNVDIRVNYAVTLNKLGRRHAALEQLETSLAMDPNHGRAHLVIGALLLEEKRLDAAERHLKKAVAVDPRSAEANLQLGKLYQRQGRLVESVERYGLVRQLEGPFQGARFWNAALLLALDRPGEAAAALDEDLKLMPEERNLRLLRIRLLAAAPESGLLDGVEARRELHELGAEIDVFFAETAAMAEAENGNFKLAAAWQQAAVDSLSETGAHVPAQIARRRLALYLREEPCRKPWEASEAMVRKAVQTPASAK